MDLACSCLVALLEADQTKATEQESLDTLTTGTTLLPKELGETYQMLRQNFNFSVHR